MIGNRNFYSTFILLMSSGEELSMIFKRIKDRVKEGSTNYNQLLKFILARADVEEKYGNMLKSCAQDGSFDASDPLLTLFADDVHALGDLHIRAANDLRTRIGEKLKVYSKTMSENAEKFLQGMKKDSSAIRKACEELEKARKEVESEEKKLQQLVSTNKSTDSQQKKLDKAKQEAVVKKDKADKTAIQIQQSSMPVIHAGFTQFDSGRMNVMQSGVREYSKILRSIAAEEEKSNGAITEHMEGFDGLGRSQRYIEKVFDVRSGGQEIAEVEGGTAIAIADFRSEEESDLKFSRGDKIQILSKHRSGWWVGRLGDTTGTFPKTYVQIQAPESADGSKSRSMNEAIGAVFLVKKNCEAQCVSDVELFSGDLVYVDYIAGQRCTGTNLRTNKKGFFPLYALEISLSESAPAPKPAASQPVEPVAPAPAVDTQKAKSSKHSMKKK